ncbi:hypothetical protein AAAC51_20305, partial [Priestia megaterium]
YDLAICKDYQNKGIGKELVNRLQDILGDGVALILLASPVAMQYYPILALRNQKMHFSSLEKTDLNDTFRLVY